MYIKGDYITGLEVNHTTTVSVTFAGKVEDTSCTGGTLSDQYGSYRNVVAQGTVTVTLFQYRARVSLKRNEIYLSSGANCEYGREACKDYSGVPIWFRDINSQCNNEHYYSELFVSEGTKITEVETDTITYAFASEHRHFAL